MATWKKWLLRIAGAWLLVIGAISTIGAGLLFGSMLLSLPKVIDILRAGRLMAPRGETPLLAFEALTVFLILFGVFMVVWGVGCTAGGIGFIRRTGYGRWLALFASGSILLISLAVIPLLGPAALRVRPTTQLLVSLSWVAVLGLCLSGHFWRGLGTRADRFKRAAVGGLVVALLMPLGAGMWMVRLQRKLAPHLPQYVERHDMTAFGLPAESVQRPLLGCTLALPGAWRISSMVFVAKFSHSMTIYNPQARTMLILERPVGTPARPWAASSLFGSDPYEALRAFYQPRWGVLPLLASSLGPFRGAAHLVELEGAPWRALAHVGQSADRAEYTVTFFAHETPTRTAEMTAVVPVSEDSLAERDILGIAASFRFDSLALPPRDELLLSVERQDRDPIQLQFALAELHGQTLVDYDVMLALAKVSMKLQEWLCAKEALRLAAGADSPRREEAQALLEQVKIAQSARSTISSNAEAN